MKLLPTPLTLTQANELVASMHRHHKPVVGHRYTIGARTSEGKIVGAAVTGRPVAREVDQYTVAEVTRLVTDGTKNACSMLYSASARAGQAMGFVRIQTYILDTESGVSLRAAGWVPIDSKGHPCNCNSDTGCAKCLTCGGNWNHSWRKGRREDQPMCRKRRYGRWLNESK